MLLCAEPRGGIALLAAAAVAGEIHRTAACIEKSLAEIIAAMASSRRPSREGQSAYRVAQ
jgi:hypothetical protein